MRLAENINVITKNIVWERMPDAHYDKGKVTWARNTVVQDTVHRLGVLLALL